MLCEQIPGIEVVRVFDNPVTLLREASGLDFDFCILDIEMPEINGLQVANLLNGKPVVFATAYKEYAAEAFDLNAVDYIRKPLSKERIEKAISKVVKYYQLSLSKRNFIHLNTDKGKTIIFHEQIFYIHSSEVDSRDKNIYLHDGTVFTAKNYSFNSLLELLPDSDFCQVNKREAVAIRAVSFFSNDEITTKLIISKSKPLVITLSDNYRSEFIRKITS